MRLGLRFDKVAVRLVESVRHALEDSVPDGKAVIFTVTAPIAQPAKTAVALQDRIRDALASPSARIETEDVILGNRIRLWVVAHDNRRSKVIGLVHNPRTNPQDLLAAALSARP